MAGGAGLYAIAPSIHTPLTFQTSGKVTGAEAERVFERALADAGFVVRQGPCIKLIERR